MSEHPLFGQEELVQIKRITDAKQWSSPDKLTKTKAPKKKAADEQRGCEFCPSNEKPGIRKIIGTVRKKATIAVIGQSPGPQENDEGIELVGPAGKWWWSELGSVGISRKDTTVLNAVKCFPADWSEGSYNSYLKMRNPSKEEIHCCSLYTEQALEQIKGRVRQIIILGQLAVKQVLKTRSLPTQKTFWSEDLQARVYLLDHPAFFIRQGGGEGPRLNAFRATLQRIADDRAELAEGKTGDELSDQFAHIKRRDYRLVVTKGQAIEAASVIRKAKGRVLFDVESDQFDEDEWSIDMFGPGYHVFACGFCPKAGLTFVFVWRHKDVPLKDGKAVFAIAKELLEDETIDKAAHNGHSDVTSLLECEGVTVKSFTHDTLYSEYLRRSDERSYGLSAIAERRYPAYSGYGLYIIPELMTEAGRRWDISNPDKKRPAVFNKPVHEQEKWVYGAGKQYALHLGTLSLDTLRLYNGADCDLGKLIEVSNKKHVPQALMNLYIDLSFLLAEMEPLGPYYDLEQHEKLLYLYPVLAEKHRKRARRLVRKHRGEWEDNEDLNPKIRAKYEELKKDFNPGSPDQVIWALYTHFGYEYPLPLHRNEKVNSQKGPMNMLALKHKFPQVILDYRSDKKANGTLESYQRSSEAHNGRLRTKWWGTGARTGRLSSGGEKDKKDSTIVNLQNIRKDDRDRNLCIADPRWKEFYNAAYKIVQRYGQSVLAFWAECDQAEATAKVAHKPVEWPKPSRTVQSTILDLQTRLEVWIREKMPDLKTYLMEDYGQVEIRVLAQLAGDENLKKDCSSGDIHTTVGTVMTGWDADRIKNDDAVRTLTKNIHFGLVYSGGSVQGVHRYVEGRSPADMRGRVTLEDIKENVAKYFARYSGVKRFIENQIAFAREHRYVKTIFGMIQTLNVTEEATGDTQSFDFGEDEGSSGQVSWENQSINGPTQGSAHQLMICALVNLIRKRKKYRVIGIPPMEVHDALYFVVNVLDLPKAYQKATYLLEKESLNTVRSDFPDIEWDVPIIVDSKAGLRLGDLTKFNENTTVGEFLLNWYRTATKHIQALDAQIEAVQESL